MTKRLFVVCVVFLSAVSAFADETAQANRLFVEAMKWIQAAETVQVASEKLTLLQDALNNLNGIVDTTIHPLIWPSSSSAVRQSAPFLSPNC